MEDCAVTTEKLAQYHVETILDYGVEGKETEKQFEKTVQEISRAMEFAGKNHHVPFVSLKVTGIARFGLLEKIHANENLSPEENQERTAVKDRLNRLCKAASENNIGILIDAEETWIQNPIDEMSMEMMR